MLLGRPALAAVIVVLLNQAGPRLMPELPEVETIRCRALNPSPAGRWVTRVVVRTVAALAGAGRS
ncbi:MAG: hypothetical protein R2864_06365 [Syntrophotaleaceae bacterium]